MRRKHQEREDWEQEVKKELSRMNHKNKMLRLGKEKQARSIEAMHKLQALNIAKSYLSNTFVNSLQWLSDNSFWRNDFQDQLNTNYKDWLFNQIENELNKKNHSYTLVDSIAQAEFEEFAKAKDQPKKQIEYNLAKKNKLRMIYHPNIRNVHFMWEPNVKPYLTEFSKKLPLMV